MGSRYAYYAQNQCKDLIVYCLGCSKSMQRLGIMIHLYFCMGQDM
jgi:hypothetical protein